MWTLLLVLSAAPVTVPFTGVLEYRLDVQGGQGTTSIAIGPRGVRSVAQVRYLDKQADATVVVRARDPEVSWVLDAATGLFTARQAPATSLSVSNAQLAGVEQIAGVSCKTVKLTVQGQPTEYCLAAGFLGSATLEALVAHAQQTPADVVKAFRALGVEGLVVRLRQQSADGKVVTAFELVKVERRALNPALFEASNQQPTR